jgi:translation initiation factor 6
LTTNKMIIVPPQTPEKTNQVGEWLDISVVRTTVGGSVVVGALACANSNGIILPHFTREKEIEIIKAASNDTNLTVINTKRTAYGNMVLTNDVGAICDPRLKPKTIKIISDSLGVEVVPGEVAGLPYVGSLALATNRGVLAHPLLKDEEKKLLEEVFKVPISLGSINCGIPYVATGLVGTDSNVVAGSLTTGPEMFIIGQALDVVN